MPLARPRALEVKRSPEFGVPVDRICHLFEDEVRSAVANHRGGNHRAAPALSCHRRSRLCVF